ncbi:hypothetical protein NMY22_g14087 [Coprinellus aureogranulatus]|nr:hypothetical protein NMY22_g14087 [Coprinellus aureogranulatus]
MKQRKGNMVKVAKSFCDECIIYAEHPFHYLQRRWCLETERQSISLYQPPEQWAEVRIQCILANPAILQLRSGILSQSTTHPTQRQRVTTSLTLEPAAVKTASNADAKFDPNSLSSLKTFRIKHGATGD